MKKMMKLASVREMFGDKVYETETGFIYNDFGKYRPNVTYILPKSFELDGDGDVLSPIRFTSDREVTDSMNLDFGGEAAFMFGDFWRSKKGGACFRPKNPAQAKDIMVRVDWGGCFNSDRGNRYGDETDGIKYFRRASSNGGGSGYDYWVVPVGFSRVIHDEEIDGDTRIDHAGEFERRAKAYRAKHTKLQREESEADDKALKAKLAAEEASRQARAKLIGRVNASVAKLDALRSTGCWVENSAVGDAYFKFNGEQFLFTEGNIVMLEEKVAHAGARVADDLVKRAERERARVEFTPKYTALVERVAAVGWKLEVESEQDRAQLLVPSHYSYSDWTVEQSYKFCEAELDALSRRLEKREGEIAEEKRQAEAKARKEATEAEAKALGLPSDVRIWSRSGATHAGQGWVITPEGMDRERDGLYNENARQAQRYDEGYEIWNQILPGELVISWAHAYTAADHEFEVIYRPKTLTEAQLERVAEIQQGLERQFLGKVGLTGTRSCPSIGEGWGLF